MPHQAPVPPCLDGSSADPYRWGDRIERVVGRHARLRPDAIAVQQEDLHLTYGQLCARAAAVSSALPAAGVGPGDVVATRLERSPELVVALLGILGAGAAYIALDPSWTAERTSDVLDRSGCALVLDDAALRVLQDGSGAPRDEVTTPRAADAGDTAACVFFTSGSTGRPKGAVSPHRATLRVLVDSPTVPLGPTTVFLQAAPLAWDAFSLELWGPLLNGGTCFLLPRSARVVDAPTLRSCVAAGVNTVWLTSTHLGVLVDEDLEAFRGIRTVLTGGERFQVATARALLDAFPDVHLVNGYGPVESTIFATTHVVTQADVAAGRTELPIGTAVARTSLLVLDDPDGGPRTRSAGELAVGGDGVALGYLSDPTETSRSFFEHDGQRYYRTGDLVEMGADGVLWYRGRIDRQFKVRGIRIEPGEIEAVVRSHPDVVSCVAFPTRDTGRHRQEVACLYTLQAGRSVDPGGLRTLAQRRLLPAMVPSVWAEVDAIPLTANGKFDVAAAQLVVGDGAAGVARPGRTQPGADRVAAERARATRPDVELGLHCARAVLEQPALGPTDDLVAHGMTSLDAVRLAARLSTVWQRSVQLIDVYDARTVGALESLVRGGVESTLGLQPRDAGPRPLTRAQERFWLAEQLDPGAADNMVVQAYIIRGPLDAGLLTEAWNDVLRRQPALRTRFPDVDGWAVQEVVPATSSLTTLELRALPEGGGGPLADTGADLDQLAAEVTRDWWLEPFRLAEEPPVRARLYVAGPEVHLLCVHVHHVCFDGWSGALLAEDLVRCYDARLSGVQPPDLGVADLALVARRELDEAPGPAHASIAEVGEWLGSMPHPFLPAPSDPSAEAAADIVTSTVPEPVVRAASDAARRAGVPTSVLLIAAAAEALRDTFGVVGDLCLGTVVDTRGDEAERNTVGYFINPVPVRIDPRVGRSATEVARLGVERALRSGRLPFDSLVRAVNPDRSRHPLFQTWALVQYPEVAVTCQALRVEPRRVHAPRTATELAIEAWPQSDGTWDLTVTRRVDGCTRRQASAVAERVVLALQEAAADGAALTSPAEPHPHQPR